MSQMQPLSLVIVAQDEERNIGRVIETAAPLVQEIIVVDSGSTDRTKEIASALGARIIDQPWLGFAKQKNFAIEQASCDWVLSLDADEVLTQPLVAEMRALLEGPAAELEKFDGYKIPRVLFIADRAIAHGGFYPDAQLRLFKKEKGRFGDRLVHEAIKMEGPTRQLQHPMNHYAYKDVAEFEQAMDKYARLSAQEFFNRGKDYYRKRLNPANKVLHPAWTFFYRYFLRGGFMDGADGLKLATIYSGYVGKKITYLHKLVSENNG
ncbi:MAG: glycosyltransferase family 2 protein [Cyanobacteria bacterium SZAS LIN-3]|nr:glycosyltransferase family 2 protein [Cyanobacteria bacterium SZAS LIN-3]